MRMFRSSSTTPELFVGNAPCCTRCVGTPGGEIAFWGNDNQSDRPLGTQQWKQTSPINQCDIQRSFASSSYIFASLDMKVRKRMMKLNIVSSSLALTSTGTRCDEAAGCCSSDLNWGKASRWCWLCWLIPTCSWFLHSLSYQRKCLFSADWRFIRMHSLLQALSWRYASNK